MLSIDNMKYVVSTLAPKYGIAKVELFGSYAEGFATEDSDADFLVRFLVENPSIFKVMGFREELGRALRCPVDVVTLPLPNPQKMNIDKVVSIYESA